MENSFKDYLAGLNRLKMDHLLLYHSPICKREAKIIGKVTSEAYNYLQYFFEKKPEIILLVLNEDDWKKRVPHQPYGDPFVPDVRVHYGSKTPNNWKEAFSSLCSDAPINLRRKIVSISGLEGITIGNALDKIFTLEFFGATAAHEIAHPFLGQNLVLPQPIEDKYAFGLDAFWLAEFLPQYIMYSFLQATNIPLCEKWFILMKSAFEGGKGKVKYTSLREMGTKYREMITSCIENIYWYQAKLFVMSADLYDQHGEDFLLKALNDLKLNERLLINQLEQSFGNLQTWLQNWK
jgi:hypothetical protein